MLDLDRARLDGKKVGVIGLGLMGRPMALNLHRAGASVMIWNRSTHPMAELAAEGLTTTETPQSLADHVDVLILMLSDGAVSLDILTRDDGVLAGLRPGALVIDMGTSAVHHTKAMIDAVTQAGGRWLDAPVSGGEVGAQEANLTIMVGGDSANVAEAMPLLQAMGRRITHVGPATAGQVTKAANQVIVGLTIGAVAEGLALARAAGVDPAKVREALEGGFAWSRVMELHGERMISGNFTPGGKVASQAKDMRQGIELAHANGLSLPALDLNSTLYNQLENAGGRELDHSALYLLFTDDPAENITAEDDSSP